ncbi:Uncharacterised protein [Escherichia coli]|nr:Uncharacterised protein [Escherichia coli]
MSAPAVALQQQVQRATGSIQTGTAAAMATAPRLTELTGNILNTVIALLRLRDACKLAPLAFELIVVFLRPPDCPLDRTVTSVRPYTVRFQFATGFAKSGFVEGINRIKAINLHSQRADSFLLFFR